ncbi:hypothetical protein GCM10027425_12600 [Alteromonas gracilis]
MRGLGNACEISAGGAIRHIGLHALAAELRKWRPVIGGISPSRRAYFGAPEPMKLRPKVPGVDSQGQVDTPTGQRGLEEAV